MDVLFTAIISILCIVAGFSKAVMDTHAFHYDKSVFKNFKSLFFTKDSWRSKYKNGDPKQGERFLGSTTIFVAFTDVWHLAQLFYGSCLILASLMFGSVQVITKYEFDISDNWLYIINLIIGFAFVKVVSLLVFNLFYDRILVKK